MSLRKLICLIYFVLPHSTLAAECGPSADLTPQDLANQHYIRPEPVICELIREQQPVYMWKQDDASGNAWPFKFAGQCTPAKGARYKAYGCVAPAGCAIFVGNDMLRIHIRREDLACDGGVEP